MVDVPTIVLCGLSEIIGWSGRLWSAYNVQVMDPFLIQLTTTIVSPLFLTTAIFNILGLIIRRVGTQYSWLSPHSYLAIFMSLDLAALILQAIGGGKASVAAQDGKDAGRGGNIMMCGVIVQVVGTTLFCLFNSDFVFRFYRNKPVCSAVSDSHSTTVPTKIPAKVRLMLLGVGITTVWVLIRSIYRTFELANGWTARVIATQAYFNALDGAPIVLAMFTLNLFHPGRLLRQESGKMCESQSTSEEVVKEDYVLEIVRPKGDYILPPVLEVLEVGWTLTVDDLWNLAKSIV